MVKLEFKIVEIPEGTSRRSLDLEGDDLDLAPYTFMGGRLDLVFYRTDHFIRVNFTVDAEVELVCDRSLEPFAFPVNTEYEMLFKVDVQEESETEEGAVRRFNFGSNTLSIEDEVRDTVLLKIPIKKLHPKYLDNDGVPEEFSVQSFGDVEEEDRDPDIADPRWEKLKKLKNN